MAANGTKPSATQTLTNQGSVTADKQTGQMSHHYLPDSKVAVTIDQAYQAFGGQGAQGIFNGYMVVHNILSDINQQRTANQVDQLHRHAEAEERSGWGHFVHALYDIVKGVLFE